MEIKIEMDREELEVILREELHREELKRNEADLLSRVLSDEFNQFLTVIANIVQENKPPSNKK